MKKIFCLLLLVYGHAHAQQATTSVVQQNNVISPSPTAASLGKYADWPVSLYSGTPEINISLYTMSSGKLSVPVSLSYHASGIKVDEYASWVGLGWSLNGGGVITRTVRGLPDDQPTYGYFSTRVSLPTPDIGHVNQANYQILQQEAQGIMDTQPDVFMFNAMGHSFKFFIDVNNKIQTIPQNTVKIEYPSFGSDPFADADQWTATFEDGTKLYFGGVGSVERTDNNNTEGYYANQGFISSWYLKQVVPVIGPAVNFTYGAETNNTFFTTSITDFIRNPNDPNYGTFDDKPAERHLSNSTIHGLHLAQITSQNTVVKFVPQVSQRADVTGGYALDSVKVYYNGKQTPVRQYKLNYIYSSSGRLRLTGITEIGADNISNINQWGLIYNANNLPALGSNAQDHWGYFNGKITNTNMLPAVEGFNNPSFPIADREAYFPYSAAEILTQINYPTGGSSAFNYEANSYNDVSTTSSSQTASLLLQESDPIGTVKSQTIVINQAQNITLTAIFRKDPNENDPLNINISLVDQQGNIAFMQLYNTNGTYTVTKKVLTAGTYRFSVSSPEMGNTYCNTSITWQNTQTPQAVVRTVGGVRLSSLIDNDGQGKTIEKYYSYDQAYCSAPIKNADYIYTITIRDHHPCAPPPNNGLYFDRVISYIARTSYNKVAVGTTGGSHIGYGVVTVKYGVNGSNGYEVNTFTNSPADQVVRQFPFPPVSSFDYRRGLLLNQNTYNVWGVIKKATTYTYNIVPNATLSAFVTGFKIDDPCTDGLSNPSNTDDQFTSTLYRTTSEWVQKASMQEDTYDNGGNKISTLSNYYYDNPVHMQATRVVSTKSDGKIITAVSTYPDDYASGTTFIDDMKTSHVIASPIEQVTYQNDGTNTTILNGVVTQYQTGGHGLIDRVYKMEQLAPVTLSAFKFSGRAIGQLPVSTSPAVYTLDGHYKERLVYNRYDALGNLQQITPTEGVSTTYLWSYNKTYPVAEIKNATYEAVESTLGGFAAVDNFGNQAVPTKAQTDAYLNVLRTSLAGTQVSTYTYSPLTGMTSTTDAKGVTTYYEYDSFQRLINIRDKDNNIVKHMDYHYQGQ
ncbi:RHS repeat domain-containing protein [Mucilaginibacter polytrichastri]|uniref:YD repeat-containing protein n=1 Tax=Mucilaginibacter polytrichastri TaxID=1302689 RepID=A0A1Q5ZVC4_9SPHI|nr:hypothetical protein [Mucilaginibacter polytrichastri]OKS85676.1 hypothetical protein RG47T_1122 [Mucilaginibacter polytrichastri]SFS62088.1 YD repeat-containing protein [Mucilaginibacter polytrichastri]